MIIISCPIYMNHLVGILGQGALTWFHPPSIPGNLPAKGSLIVGRAEPQRTQGEIQVQSKFERNLVMAEDSPRLDSRGHEVKDSPHVLQMRGVSV